MPALTNTSGTVLVTGANNGLGYETVKAFLQSEKPHHIFLGSRSLEKGKLALEKLRAEVPGTASTVEVLAVDLSNDQSIENAFEQVKSRSVRNDWTVCENDVGTLVTGSLHLT